MNSSEEPATGAGLLLVGEFKIDTVRRRLCGADGNPVELSPRLFDALLYFVEHRGELLDKERLLLALWPGQVVEENNLNKAVSALRRALGDDGEDKRYLLTVPRRGFRFVAEVRPLERQSPAAAPPAAVVAPPAVVAAPLAAVAGPSEAARTDTSALPRSRRRAIVAGGLASATMLGGLIVLLRREPAAPSARGLAPGLVTLAVLPFGSLAGGTGDEVLEIGMADSLIARLSSARGVVVRPVASVRRLAGRDVDPLRAARELEVAWVLEGSIGQADGRTRVSARLINARDGSAAWSGSFEGSFGGVFEMHDSISQRVAEVVMPHLTAGERAGLSGAGTRSTGAYRLYLEARHQTLIYSPDSLRRAQRLFEQAIEADPGYAYAHLGLADLHRRLPFSTPAQPATSFAAARASAQRALELDPRLGEAQAVLASVSYWLDWDWPAAARRFLQAQRLTPSSVDALYGYAHLRMTTGHAEDALEWFRRAREVDPLALQVRVMEGAILAMNGRTDEGLEEVRRTLQINPDFWIAHVFLGNMLFNIGRHEEGLASLQRAVTLSQGSNWASGALGHALAERGNHGEARRLLRQMASRAAAEFVSPASMAVVHAGLHEPGPALDLLEQAYERRDHRLVFLQVDHRWDALRGQARFVALARRLALDPLPPRQKLAF